VRVDATLQVIIVGFRLVTAVWITVLGMIAIVSWGASPGVVGAALAVSWVWTALTFATMRGGRLSSLPWLIADIVVAILIVLSDSVDGATQAFVGGFPMTSVLLWGFAHRIPGGIGSSAAISAAIVAIGESDLAGSVAIAVLYLAVGGVAAWAFEVLRDSERGRLRAESALVEEHAARIRFEERAEVAAHLHDSVLQTLTLIQKSAADAPGVRNLARVQERELRSWLLGTNKPEDSLVGAHESACSEIEKRFGVEVELVSIGDRHLDDRLHAVVGATAESVMNAAKHAGVELVSVYADANANPVQVFIRDRGVGFDPEAVGDDRRGLVESVFGRVERHGGSAEVVSTAGSGTEVRLTMPVQVDGMVQGDG
jgi:signal transduction histidine kinase